MGRVSINSETARVVLDALESRYFYSDSDGEEYNDEEVISAAAMLRNDISPQWISVAERLPEDVGVVMLHSANDSDKWITIGYRSGGGWYVIEAAEALGYHDLERFTHWMPLPEPPESRQ